MNSNTLKVLYLIHNLNPSCQFMLRYKALKKYADVVDLVNISAPATLWYRIANRLFKLGLPIPLPDIGNANNKLKLHMSDAYNVVWVEKGLTISADSLKEIKNSFPHAILVNITPDNMMERPWQSQQYLNCIPIYDFHITTKPFIVEKFYKKGARNVILVNKTFQSDFHYPRELSEDEKNRLGAEVGFVGTWEKERCESLIYLAEHGIHVKVFGEWEWKKYVGKYPNLTIIPHALYDEDYAKAFSAFKISLCFLKKRAFDTITLRSVEIPACGGFMLAERTRDHQALFEEDKEAVYFDSNEELLEKCLYYLSHEEERKKIAKAGRQRCIDSDYSNETMIKKVFDTIKKKNQFCR